MLLSIFKEVFFVSFFVSLTPPPEDSLCIIFVFYLPTAATDSYCIP